MLSVLMFSLTVAVTDLPEMPMAAFSQQGDPPVKLWLSEDHPRLGDRVRVDVRTEADGYLLVLHSEPDGRVRVLFPLDPIHDNFVRGGEEFEIRGRGDREAFRVYSSEGVGTVFAAFSRDPFQFEEYVRGDHWDYGLRDVWFVADDPEPEITDLVLRLASGAYFDYDFVQYGVGETVVAASRMTHLNLYADPYYYDTYNVGIGLNFGGYYDPFWTYRPWWRIGFMGWPSRYYVRSAYSRWGFYDPWFWGGYYDPWNYGYGYGYGYGYYDYYPRYRYRSPTVVWYSDNRLRSTTRTPLRPSNSTSRARRAYVGTLGSTVRRASVANVTSASARRLVASGRSAQQPARRVTTAAGARRAVDNPRTAPAARSSTANVRRTTDATRRSVNTTEQQPARRVTSRNSTTRQTTPARVTSANRRETPSRSVTPTRSTVTTRRATPARSTVTTRSTTPSRSSTTIRRTTPSRSVTTRSAPMRSSSPSTSRSTPIRSSRPSTSRSTPIRSSRPTTSRSTPIRSSRPSTSRSTPIRSSRPSTSRSAPVRSSRPSTVRSAPARSSAPRATSSSSSRSSKPATTTRRRKP